jgi:ubiquitin C-terminal hydrolase
MEMHTSSCVSKLERYSLQAISSHFGTMTGGHYTATTRNWIGTGFSLRNDSVVGNVTPSEAADYSAAYILFYQKIK